MEEALEMATGGEGVGQKAVGSEGVGRSGGGCEGVGQMVVALVVRHGERVAMGGAER